VHVSNFAKTDNKIPKNKRIKMTNTFFFFHVKNVLKPPMIDASMILEQDWGKKIEFEGID